MAPYSKTKRSTDQERIAFLRAALPLVPKEGWSNVLVQSVEKILDQSSDYFMAIFPGGVEDLVAEFSNFLDEQMMDRLTTQKMEKMRIRDKIEMAVMERFGVAEPYKDACRLALAYWSVPPRTLRAARVVWRTADRMWDFAGDTATDYNRYTKRVLLSGVITSTTLVWMKDSTDHHDVTQSFLKNRIDNVLNIGQVLSKIKPRKL